jgi:hypothetical protein
MRLVEFLDHLIDEIYTQHGPQTHTAQQPSS